MQRSGANAGSKGESRGASTVIGIVLLVGITVLLAAVVGAYAFGLGGNMGKTQPQTQLSVEDADQLVAHGSSPHNVLTIRHKGGDAVKTTGVRLVIRKDGEIYYSALLKDTPYQPASGAPDSYETLTATGVSDQFTSGETITVTEQTGHPDAFESGTYRVQLIHVKSNTVLANEKLKIN